MAWKKQYTPEQKAEYQAQKRAEMEQIFHRIDEGVKQVFTSERYRDYLKFMSRFTNYSANNTLLIMMQRPDATLVASYGKWKQLGRQVDKGQSGIEILAPVTYKTNQIMEIERPVTDEFGNKVYNEDGTEKTEIQENPVMDVAFKKVYVFDVSQTSGKEIPDPVQELQGEIDVDKKEAMLKALSGATGIDITFADIKGGAKGYYSPSENRIVVQSGMSDTQTLKTAIHEAAHKLLHDPDLKMDTVQSPRSEKEVQAESTAFIVAERFGLDTSDYSFPYIASWSDGKQLEQLTKVLEDVQAAAKKLSAAIESELLKMQKRDLTTEEMLADTDLSNVQKAEILIDGYAQRGVVFTKAESIEITKFAGEHEDIAETVRMMEDMQCIRQQKPVTEEQPPDISPEEYLAGLDFDTVNRRPSEVKNSMEQQNTTNPNVIGNTPYKELCKEPVQYVSGLKPRHADNIAKQLTADGIPFSGVKKVKASYSRTKAPASTQPVHFEQPQTNVPKNIPERKLPESLKDVPIITISFLEAKQNGTAEALRDSIMVSKACRDFVDEHLRDAYENRDLKGLVQELEEQFGIERTMYTLAATIQLKKHDGRFRPDVKKQAAQFTFDSDKSRLRFLTERHPVMLNHLYEHLMEREQELNQVQAAVKKPELPGHLSDKLLLSTERVELRDDYRGIPETNYYNSSVNEYFVDEIGWLDNDAYERELKLSELSAKNFYSKVTKINADCIDAEGTVSQVDMSPQDYQLLTDKTYAPENRLALEMAKAKLAERMNDAGLEDKPVEQYAVRQNTNNRYAVCTISADGLVTAVKPGIATIAEAKKAMLELFEQRKAAARCELVHPQVLDEASAALYKEQSHDLPDVVYRIQISDQRDAPESHFVQQYVRNADDSYKVGQVMTRGDYFSCNAALAELIADTPTIAEQREKVLDTDFEIYQLKSGDATRSIRFESYDSLAEQGIRPDIANYMQVYAGRMADVTEQSDLRIQLEAIFHKFNVNRPEDFKGHSLSVSDVVTVKGQAFYVDTFGFKPLKEFIKPVLTESKFLDALPERPIDKQKQSKITKL